jgi:drug/metabolite transporter (DMT)-like permease
VLRGEIPLVDVGSFSTASLVALVYLITIGSWVGFTSYVWLLRNARTSLVSTYAYVNPVVAVFLGWLILDETITIRMVVAGAIIIVAVAIIISTGGTARTDDGVEVEASSESEQAVA